MQKVFSKILNRDKANLKWTNSNIFYIISILVLVIWIICYCCYNQIDEWILQVGQTYNEETGVLTDNNWCILLQSFLANLSIIMLFPICLYFERKYGSIKLLILLIFAIPLSNICSWGYAARLSALSFFITALFFIDFVFDIKYYKTHKLEIIFAIIIFIICVLFMCINTDPFSFGLFSRLLYDAHLLPFIAGLCTGIIFNIYKSVP